MKKSLVAILAAVVVIALVVGGIFLLKGNGGSTGGNVKLETGKDLENLVDKIYEKSKLEMFGLETRELNLKDENDEMAFPSYTGLQSSDNIETVVVSESMISATAYSLTIVKVKDGADVEAIKQEMANGVDMRKWICVQADVVLATNSGNVIFMVMSNKEDAKAQLDAFKSVVGGKFGKDVTREAEVIDFDFDETVPGLPVYDPETDNNAGSDITIQ